MLDEEIYDIWYNVGEGCQVLCVNYRDDIDPPSNQGYYKFIHYGRVLDQYFLDGNYDDYYAWEYNGYVPMNYVVGINGLVYFQDSGYDHDAMVAAIERTIYGENSDTDPPYVASMDPDDGDTNVDPNTDIEFNLLDNAFGIDEGTLSVEVTYDGSGGPIPGDLTEPETSHFLDMDLTFDPDDTLPPGTEVTVTVEADDLVGNSMFESWSFTTGSTSIKTVSLGELKATFK